MRVHLKRKSTLAELKKNGFDVQYVECLLDKLIKLKDEYKKQLEEKSAVQAQQQQHIGKIVTYVLKLKTMRLTWL